jgi:hypothetical protein
MSALLFRMRVAVLWVAVAVAMSGSMLLYLYVPGALQEMLAGEMEGATLDDSMSVLLAMVVMIPLLMAGVTLLVSDRANRSVNLIAGLSFGLLVALVAGSELLAGDIDGHILMGALAGVLAFLIAMLGLVEPRHRFELG